MPGGEEWWKQKGTSVETPPSRAAYEARRALKWIELHNATGISMALARREGQCFGSLPEECPLESEQ